MVKINYPIHSCVARLKGEKPRASSLSLPVMNQRITVSNWDIRVQLPAHAPSNELDVRARCSSLPVLIQKELETQVASEQENVTTSSLRPLSRDLNATKSTYSEDSDSNSETDNFIREHEEFNSKL